MPYLEPLPLVWQKRVFDTLVSSLLLVALAALFFLVLLCMVIEHSLRRHPFDPLFYREVRISRGRRFLLCKFNIFDHRIIEELRSQDKVIHTKVLEKNGNLTFCGKVLKQIYLDELPQLVNVVCGEMSLVGPRPLNPEVFADLEKTGVPPQALLLGGMTGNFQSHKDTGGMTAAVLEKEYLHIYTTHSGWFLVWTDIKIMLRTVKVILRAKGV